MNFVAISEGHNCNCHTTASENCVDTFARKVGETKDFKERDFKSYHERNKIPDNDSCEEICGNRGLSMEIWNRESSAYLINKYSQSHGISPMLKPKNQIGVFRLIEGAGKVKHTPNQKFETNIYHYDLYKSDEFSIGKICLVDVIPLINYNV